MAVTEATDVAAGDTDPNAGLPPLGERPLVTFAVFAYNQEKYIREAVEGAFSQSYQPLEIILSDDCSSDRTFEIMQEMAAAYQGPHTVWVRRNDINLGTAAHFSSVAALSKGESLVVAAGDDVSKPERAKALIRHWIKSGRRPGIYHSNLLRFSDSLASAAPARPRKVLSAKEAKSRIYRGGPYYIFAPTFMYTRDFLSEFPPLLGGSIVEDGPMIYRCALIADFFYIDEFLVYARSSGVNSGMGLTIQRPKHWNRLFRSRIMTAFNTLSDAAHLESKGVICDKRIAKAMTKRIRHLSNFIIPETDHVGWIDKLRLAFHFALGRAYSSNLKANLSLGAEVLLGGRSLRRLIGWK